MKRIATVAAALAATVVVSSPAFAATAVTESNLDHVQIGEPKAQVQHLLGTHGFRLYTQPTDFGTRIVKLYNGDGDNAALVTYFRTDASKRFRVIDTSWCHDNLTCS